MIPNPLLNSPLRCFSCTCLTPLLAAMDDAAVPRASRRLLRLGPRLRVEDLGSGPGNPELHYSAILGCWLLGSIPEASRAVLSANKLDM